MQSAHVEGSVSSAAAAAAAAAPTGLAALAAGLASHGTLEAGENGMPEHSIRLATNIQDLLVALNGFATHSHGHEASLDTALGNLRRAITAAPEQEDETVRLVALLLAHTRDCRKEGMGRGSKSPSWIIFCWMWAEFPARREMFKEVFTHLYELFGSFQDLNHLNRKLETLLSVSKGRNELRTFLRDEWVRHLTHVQWVVDVHEGRAAASAAGEPPKLENLAAKWAPREKKQDDRMAKMVADVIFRTIPRRQDRMKRYRKMLSCANRLLNTVEVHMCHDGADPDCPTEGDWDIDFAKVPGRCQHVHKKAFEKHRPDRWAAYLESLKAPDSKGAKGTSVFITELCRQLSYRPDELAEAQWKDQVKNLREAAAANGHDLGDFLSNFVCLLDFSGSMSGEPMELAWAMGAFLTPLQKGPFRNKCISFETRPHWVDISGARTVYEALQVYQRSPWGGSTNFAAAHTMILQVLRDERARGATAAQVKALLPKFFLVVSDMQFDYAQRTRGGWETMHVHLQKLYRDTGMELIGEPLELPTMVYWNARADTGGMPVCRSSEKALFVTGFSTAVVKTFLTSGIEELASMTPWSYLHKTLTSPWYLRVLGEDAEADGGDDGAPGGGDDGAPGGGDDGAPGTPAGSMSAATSLAPPVPCALYRQIGAHKYAQAHEVLTWVRSLGDEMICGLRAKDITVFPAAVFHETFAPCVHWVEVGALETTDGKSELFDHANRLHQQLDELWNWFRGEEDIGFKRWLGSLPRELDFA